MRIDFERRMLTCSVGDLVQDSAHRRLGSDRGEGFRRMWLGQEIHSRRAEERAAADPTYRPEVSVNHRCKVGEWEVVIQGRIDGLSRDTERKRLVIEEVKSVHFDLELAALYRSDKLQRYLFQLMLYGFFLSMQSEYGDYELAPQLVLIDLVSGEARVIEAPYDPASVQQAFGDALTRIVEEIETERALRLAKKAFAEGLTFPHDRLRPFQQEMVDAVSRAIRHRETLLAAAPTGVGKTVAALYPALCEALKKGKKLFFLTAKTLQQELAVKVLSAMNDGSFRVLRIRAKQKMCAHTEVICHPDFCPYAAQYNEKMQRTGLVSRIATDYGYFDPDVTFELAKSHEVCPFEVSLELLEEADVIVCDYNYIFDPYVGLKTFAEDGDYGDCIFVIDEAHNLVDRGRGYYSPELEEKIFDSVYMHLRARPGSGLEGWEELLDELQAHFREIAESLDATPGAKQGLCDPDVRLFRRQRTDWERLLIQYVSWKISAQIAEEEDPLIDFYFKLVKVTNLLSEEGDEFARIIERTDEGLKLKIFCKDPSKFLGEIMSSAYSVVAMSATLEPFDFYRQTLGFPKDRVSEISLPSPFPRDNRKIVIINDVDTTYKERASHYGRIGEKLAALADSIEGNVLALFPSYSFLNSVAPQIPMVSKNLLIQKSDMTDYERRSFLHALEDSRREGTFILAVSGGMYAEGIDYQGDMLSGVFVVGPALPTVTFEQELLKRYYDEQYGTGFEYAYLIPGMTRVVQAAGRVIRSEKDVGVIALLCKRFTNPSYTKFFPLDWYESSPRELVSKQPADEIRLFLEAKKAPPQLRMW